MKMSPESFAEYLRDEFGNVLDAVGAVTADVIDRRTALGKRLHGQWKALEEAGKVFIPLGTEVHKTLLDILKVDAEGNPMDPDGFEYEATLDAAA